MPELEMMENKVFCGNYSAQRLVEKAAMYADEEDDHEDSFHIDNDSLADWAVSKLHEIKEGKDRVQRIYDERVAVLQGAYAKQMERLDESEAFFLGKLEEYFQSVPAKETKTQKSYKLLSGTLKYTKPKKDFEHDDAEILSALESAGIEEWTKVTKKLDWSGLKKSLSIDGDDIVNADGEVVEIPGLRVTMKEGKFTVS